MMDEERRMEGFEGFADNTENDIQEPAAEAAEATETAYTQDPANMAQEETAASAYEQAAADAAEETAYGAQEQTFYQNTDTQSADSQSTSSYGWTQPQQYGSSRSESRYTSYQFTQPQQDDASYNNRKQHSSRKAEKKKSGGFGRIVKGAIACICGGVVLGASAYGAIALLNHVAGQAVITEESTATPTISTTTTSANVAAQTTTTASSGEVVYDISSMTAEVMPSVVSIVNTGTTEVSTFWGQQEQGFTSSGSGVIVGTNDTELLIATNNHVIANCESLEITFVDDTTATAVVKGQSDDMDLAVVAVTLADLDQSTIDSIKVATLGDSDSLQVGEPAIAIGNALGYGQSVTSGIISALDREVTVTTDSTYGYGNSQTITSKLIQTDAAINPGNSGGPLFNIEGEVIGINSVKYASSSVEGMGYAIPISAAEPILDELMNRETKTKVDDSERSYLGITGADVTSQAQSIYGMPSGAYVVSVVEGSAAEEAGIKKGDIIVKLGDTSVSSMEELQEELEYYKAGETVEVVVSRSDGSEYTETTLEVTLDEYPETLKDDDSSTGSDSNKGSSNSGSGSGYGSGSSNGMGVQ